MKRRGFIKSFFSFFGILLIKPSSLLATTKAITLGQKAPDFQLIGFNKKYPNIYKRNTQKF